MKERIDRTPKIKKLIDDLAYEVTMKYIEERRLETRLDSFRECDEVYEQYTEAVKTMVEDCISEYEIWDYLREYDMPTYRYIKELLENAE